MLFRIEKDSLLWWAQNVTFWPYILFATHLFQGEA